LAGRGKQPLKGIANGSLTAQAREAILNAILDGVFGERLPPEDELAEMLNVSRTTVRAAVQDLEREGLIKRRRAIGTTVNTHVGLHTLALQRLVGFDWLLAEKNEEVKVDSSWRRETPTDFADQLPWGSGVDCCVMEKRYLADGKLAIALRDFVPWSELSVEKFPDEPPPSLFDFSRLYCKEAITHAIVQLVPMAKVGDTATELALPVAAPFMRMYETHYSDNARPIAWTCIDVDDGILRFEVYRGEH
jgi:GntR family transcriptional regulator